MNVAENRKSHVTEEYDDENALIVRRGYPVKVSIDLSNDLKKVNCQVRGRKGLEKGWCGGTAMEKKSNLPRKQSVRSLAEW